MFTHINGYPSATGRAQNRESSLAKDRRSTAVPRNQPILVLLGSLRPTDELISLVSLLLPLFP